MKRIFSAVVCVLLLASAQAQDPKFGLKAGVNLSTLNYSGNTDADWRTGFHAGVISHIHLTPAFSLQPELYYSSQGAEFENGNNDAELKLSYLNLPVLFQYNFNNGFRFQGGPQIGFLMDDEFEVGNVSVNNATDLKTVDFSFPVGFSYLSHSGIGVDARYNIGISNINDDGGSSVRNNVIQFGVFYLFDHKHKAKSR